MEPKADLVCSLLETSFSLWTEEDKKDLLFSCSNPQPVLSLGVDLNRPRPNEASSSQTKKVHKRNFQVSWYKTYPWLCGSVYKNKLFCWTCLIIGVKKGTWNYVGFDNLSTATRAFQKHEGSSEHIKNSVGYRALQKNLNRISDALKENTRLFVAKFNENVRMNRQLMKLPIDAVLFLSKQELSFRGHDEKVTSVNRGNFKELLHLLVQNSPVDTKQQYEKVRTFFSADSKTIQNELISCIADHIKETIDNEIKEAEFFSLQVDDTTDISQKSQCSVIVRFVSKKGNVEERFLGFFDLSSDRTAEAVFEAVQAVLEKFVYCEKLIAQCYDGASVMAGHLNGLQTRVKEKAPQAVFIHCLAHRLNLVLKQSVSSISQCRIFFSTLSSIPNFFHNSAKRTWVADTIVGKRIPSGVDTRWSSTFKVLKVVNENWDGLKDIFTKIIEDRTSQDTSIQQARGYLRDFKSFDFTLMTIVFYEIFSLTDILFDILQKKSLDITYCVGKIEQTKQLILAKRNEEVFKTYFDQADAKTPVEIKRSHRLKTKEDYFDHYKILFFEVLDVVVMEINTRFQDMNKLEFLCLADSSKFPIFSKSFPEKALESLNQAYPSKFNLSRLKNELSFIYSDKDYNNFGLEKIVVLLNENDSKDIFKEVYKLFSLILTIPSTSCSVERSFSCLKRLKTYLRNSTSQERLNDLAIISIEKKLLNELLVSTPFHEDIITKFAKLKDRKLDLIFKKEA